MPEENSDCQGCGGSFCVEVEPFLGIIDFRPNVESRFHRVNAPSTNILPHTIGSNLNSFFLNKLPKQPFGNPNARRVEIGCNGDGRASMYKHLAGSVELGEMKANVRRSLQSLELCWGCERICECERGRVDADVEPVWLCCECQVRSQSTAKSATWLSWWHTSRAAVIYGALVSATQSSLPSGHFTEQLDERM